MRRHGSTLIEVSIAAGLVAVAMIAVAQLLAVAARQDRSIEHRQLAAQEAANSLELVLARPWNELNSEWLQSLSLSPQSERLLPDGKLVCELETLAEEPAVKKVVTTVTWKATAHERNQLKLCAWRFQSERTP